MTVEVLALVAVLLTVFLNTSLFAESVTVKVYDLMVAPFAAVALADSATLVRLVTVAVKFVHAAVGSGATLTVTLHFALVASGRFE